MYLMKSYDDALQNILENGAWRTNKRTKLATKSIFGLQTRYRLDQGYFPLLTRRKVWPKSVFAELLWFLSGSTSNKDLNDLGCKFWNPWVDKDFEQKNGYAHETFGPVYGFQLRHFGGHYGNGIGGQSGTEDVGDLYGSGGFDQLQWVVNRIKEDHSCRRTLWTLWNPSEVGKMRLPPCHMLFQICVDDDMRMTGILKQRSADYPVGIPANIQFYSALVIMLAQQTGCTPYELVHEAGDAHIYEDQFDAVKQYLDTPVIESPKLTINKAKCILSYTSEDFILEDFTPGPKIEVPVAV